MQKQKEVVNSKPNIFLYFAAATVNLTSFASGIAFAWPSPVIPKLTSTSNLDENPLSVPITSSEESWIVSLMSLGATVGPFLGGYGADRIGRKLTLLLSTVPIIISFILTSFATTVTLFYIARFMVGISGGIVMTVVPMYIGEVAEIKNRGTLGCFMVGFLALGYMFSYAVGPFTSIMWFGLTCVIGPIICLVIFSVFVPETPYYLVAQNNLKAAQESLLKYRCNCRSTVDQELSEITTIVRESLAMKGGILDVFKSRGLIKGLLVAVGLVTLQQMSAISVILFYMQSIFESSGISISSDIATIIVGLVQCFCAITASLIVEKLGRKILLYLSMTGCSSALITLGVYFYLKDNGYNVESIFWLPMTSLIGFIAMYNLGLGPIPYSLLGEIFPPHVKSVSSALSIAVCLLMSFSTSKIFPYLVECIGNSFTFWLFGTCTALSLVFTYVLVPETKGKTLNEIQYELSK